MPLISIIIPVYNVEEYIQQCVESVLMQTFSDIEVILVDDGSIDKSGEICDMLGKRDKRIKVIHKKNGGLSDARNEGVNNAAGRYIMFLDGDDYWEGQDSLQYLVDKIENSKDPELILFNSRHFYTKKNRLGSKPKSFDINQIDGKNPKEVARYLIQTSQFHVSACLKVIKKDILINNRIKFMEDLLGEDIDWYCNLFLHLNNIYAINHPFYRYRQEREGSITNSISIKNIKDLIYIIKRGEERLEINVEDDMKQLFKSFFAYEYVQLLFHYNKLNKIEKKEVKKEIKNLSYLLNYRQNKRVKIVRIVYKILGFNATAYLLQTYHRYFLNRQSREVDTY